MAAPFQAPPALVFKDICVAYKGREDKEGKKGKAVFDNLNLRVAPGKCTCLLGPSGCGKSTLLKLVSGDPAISYSGNLSFHPDNRAACWMSQNDLLLPWMSLHDNVMLGAKLRGEVDDEIRHKASDLLAQAGLSDYEGALPATLSGGMRQRGALLRTLMENRSLLLMDEPFSALDALTRLKLQDLAAAMTRGKTVLLVTHDPMEALRMADEIVLFSGVPAIPRHFGSLPGTVPREAGNPQTAVLYSDLLGQLMEEQP